MTLTDGVVSSNSDSRDCHRLAELRNAVLFCCFYILTKLPSEMVHLNTSIANRVVEFRLSVIYFRFVVSPRCFAVAKKRASTAKYVVLLLTDLFSYCLR